MTTKSVMSSGTGFDYPSRRSTTCYSWIGNLHDGDSNSLIDRGIHYSTVNDLRKSVIESNDSGEFSYFGGVH